MEAELCLAHQQDLSVSVENAAVLNYTDKLQASYIEFCCRSPDNYRQCVHCAEGRLEHYGKDHCYCHGFLRWGRWWLVFIIQLLGAPTRERKA